MSTRSLLGIWWVGMLAWQAWADPPAGYYASAEGESGAELKAALHEIIRGHTVIPYSSSSRPDTADALGVLDAPAGQSGVVRLIYSRRLEPVSTFGQSTGWNREHLWPNSYGLDDVQPAYSDLHNLRAADMNVNSARGNKLYDESDRTDARFKEPAHAEAPATSTDGDSWEPPDEVKGDIARALFYMDVRYEGGGVGEPQLVLTDDLARINSAATFMGRMSTLIQWHRTDPVDAEESARNDTVWTEYQGNRNPFVDYPEWVEMIFLPVLTISRDGDTVVLSWSAHFPDAVVEAAAEIGSTWTPVNQAPVRNGEVIALTVSTGSGPRLFRLRLR